MAPSTYRILALLILAIVTPIAGAAPRLGTDVIPYEYRLEVRPDLRRETFVVIETIRVRVSVPVSEITLHAADLEIERASVRSSVGKQKATVDLDPQNQLITLRFDDALEPGEAEIRIDVRGKLGDSLRGFYLSESAGKRYAFTQLQPADARRFFPCFDEPALKAEFDLIVAVDAHESAISNARILSVLPGPAPGTKRIRFAKTPPISTYMLALAVGDFDCLSDRAGDVPIRLCAKSGKAELGKYALSVAKKSIEYFEEWTGVDYPFDKLDLVAVPDFAAGGMENPGAIFYRDATVLVDPDKAPLETRRWVAELITHELSHMWVGDLVTMKWWDDLWLNEGLATWMAHKALAATQPELEPEIPLIFSTMKALEVDSLEGTRAPVSPVDDSKKVVELFDAMTNDKPAAVMAMAESLAGEKAMRRAIRNYLVTWSWGSATTDDFLAAVEPEIGSAAAATIRDFVTRPGYPKLSVSSRCEGGRQRVTVTQRPVRESLRAAGPWTLPLCVRRTGESTVNCSPMSGESTEIDVGTCGSDFIINPGLNGFYRTSFEPGAVRRMLDADRPNLGTGDRIMLLDSEWSSFRAGERTVGDMLGAAESVLSTESSAAVLTQVAMQLSTIEQAIAEESELAAFKRWVAETTRAGAAGRPAATSEDSRRMLESELEWIGGAIGDDPEIRARGLAYAKDYLRDPWKERKANTDVMLAIAARSGDAALFDAILARLRKTKSEQERYRLVFALGSFAAPELVDRTLRLTLDGTVRPQDAATLISRLVARRETSERAWKFLRDEWPKVKETLPPGFTSDRIVRAAGAFCDSTRRAEVETFFSSPDAPAAPRALAASLSAIDRCVTMRAKHQGELGQWLAASAGANH